MFKFLTKINFPPFFYVKAFWEYLSTALAGILGLLVLFRVLSVEWLYGAGSILAFFLSVLKFLDIEPQMRARQAIKEASALIKKKGKK